MRPLPFARQRSPPCSRAFCSAAGISGTPQVRGKQHGLFCRKKPLGKETCAASLKRDWGSEGCATLGSVAAAEMVAAHQARVAAVGAAAGAAMVLLLVAAGVRQRAARSNPAAPSPTRACLRLTLERAPLRSRRGSAQRSWSRQRASPRCLGPSTTCARSHTR